MEERSVFDGRWHLIYREKITPAWRQVQEDSKAWVKWRNRSYDETVKYKEQFPEQYRILTEMDPQSLGGSVHPIELYDLQKDPDEMHNLAPDKNHQSELSRLYAALQKWVKDTQDTAVDPLPLGY